MRNRLASLKRTFVWLGQLAVAYEASTIDYRMFLNVSSGNAQREAEAYCSTISVGKCVLQVLSLRGLEDVQRLKSPFAAAQWSLSTVSVWPIAVSSFDWPPSNAMDAQGHSQFIDRGRDSQEGEAV